MDMKATLIAIAIAAAAATSPSSHASATVVAANASAPRVQAMVDDFFSKLRDGKIGEAYAGAFTQTLVMKKQADVENLIGQTETALRYYGKIRDWEELEEKRESENLIFKRYLLRTAVGPLYFKFTIYNNGDTWMIVNLFFTDRFDQSGI